MVNNDDQEVVQGKGNDNLIESSNEIPEIEDQNNQDSIEEIGNNEIIKPGKEIGAIEDQGKPDLIEGIDNEHLLKAGEIIGAFATKAIEELPGGQITSLVLEQILGLAFEGLNEEEPIPVWDAVKNQVATAIWTDKIETKRKFLQGKLTDFNLVAAKLKQYDNKTQSYSAELISFENIVETSLSNFMTEDSSEAFYTLPFFVPFASLHLGLLLDKLHWAKENDKKIEEPYRKDHADAVRKYGFYMRYMLPKAIDWRMNRIEIKSEKYRPIFLDNLIPQKYIGQAGIRYKGSLSDLEKPENNSSISDEYSDQKLIERKEAFKKDVENLMDITVRQAIDKWVKEKYFPEIANSNKLSPGQILWEESLTSGNYQLQVKGDTVKLVDTKNYNKVIWGRQYPDKNIFLILTEQEFSIYSGSPFGKFDKQKRIWSAGKVYQEEKQFDNTAKPYLITELTFQDSGQLVLGAKREGETLSDPVLTIPQDTIQTQGQIRLAIGKVTFKCTYSEESGTHDKAEVNKLAFKVKFGTQDWESSIEWSGSPWEVEWGSVKDLDFSWTKVVDLSDTTSNLTFQTYTREDDWWGDDEDTEEHSISMAEINKLVQIWGDKYNLNHKYQIEDGDVHFDVSFVLSIEPVKPPSVAKKS